MTPALLRNLLLRAQLGPLALAFGTPPALRWVLFKGFALSARLERPMHTRHVLDLDVWVAPRDVLLAAARLEELGFACAKPVAAALADTACWQLPFVRWVDGVRLDVDLHWRLLSPWLFQRSPPMGRVSEPLRLDQTDVLTLNTTWTVLQLAAHWAQHEGTEPRILDDLVAAGRDLVLDWMSIRQEARAYGLERALQHALWCAHQRHPGAALPILPLSWPVRVFLCRFPQGADAARPGVSRHLGAQLLGDLQGTPSRLWEFAFPARLRQGEGLKRRTRAWRYATRAFRGVTGLLLRREPPPADRAHSIPPR